MAASDRRDRSLPRWQRWARAIGIAMVLAFTWWIACESLRERSPRAWLLFASIAYPVVVAAFWPRAWSGLREAAALAAALIALDVAADLWIPYQRRFAWPGWQLLRSIGCWLGAYLASRFASSIVARLARIVVRAVTVLVLTCVLAAMVFLRVDGWRDRTTHADAALVLGFALGADGRPLPSLVARVEHAVDLHRRGLTSTLLMTGGRQRGLRSEAEVMRDLAVRAGVSARDVAIEPESHSTGENITRSAPTLRALGARRVLVVTEPFHIPTAMLLARRAGIDAFASPAASPASRDPRACSYWLFRDALEWIRYAAWR